MCKEEKIDWRYANNVSLESKIVSISCESCGNTEGITLANYSHLAECTNCSELNPILDEEPEEDFI